MTNQTLNIGIATQIRGVEEATAIEDLTQISLKESVIYSTEQSLNNSIETIKLDKALELDNSSLFDVHRWSEYP